MEHFHQWVKCFLEGLETRVDRNLLAEILSNCGRRCIPESFIEEKMKVWSEALDLDVVIENINDSWSGAGADAQIRKENSDLMVEYGECYCPLVKESVQEMPSIWCECSRGWLMQLFESFLGDRVRVELLESVQRGNEKCRFKIIF